MTPIGTNPTITELAMLVEDMVNRIPSDDPFSTDATLFGIDREGAYIIGSGRDPYEVLENTPKPHKAIAVALLVSGWASPITDEEIRPSQHPERIRIRLVNAIGDHGMSTVMRRADQPDDVEDLGSDGEGALRDAMEAWWAQL